MNTVYCLMGPTASGKTSLALELAECLPVEIINVDSAQIYRGMGIGTGMPRPEIRQRTPHHLMDFLEPNVAYSAAQFRIDALAIIPDILRRNRIPLLVGGTMLYFKVLQQGLSALPCSSPTIRLALKSRIQKEGLPSFYAHLQQVDPITANRLEPTDTQRIMRALEIYEMSQKPLSTLLQESQPEVAPFQFVNIGLIPLETLRKVLHERIAIRFDAMLEQGLITEVRALLNRGDLNESMPSLRAVGYRQMIPYLTGHETFECMREKAMAATRQLAKRQLTWLRHWPTITFFDFLDENLTEKTRAHIQCAGVLES